MRVSRSGDAKASGSDRSRSRSRSISVSSRRQKTAPAAPSSSSSIVVSSRPSQRHHRSSRSRSRSQVTPLDVTTIYHPLLPALLYVATMYYPPPLPPKVLNCLFLARLIDNDHGQSIIHPHIPTQLTLS